jgi:hypothetical protein
MTMLAPKTPQQRNTLLFVVLGIYVVVVLGAFALRALASGDGQLLMPLDDVYIHFQYARQLSLGQPYVYNTGEPPTSGATSFIYPYILSVGYLLGFTGLQLGWWALFVGVIALLVTAIVTWRFLSVFSPKFDTKLAFIVLFLTTGSFLWHVMSGMETLILLSTMSLTLWTFATNKPLGFAISASLLALTRPEGSIMALVAVPIALFAHIRSMSWRRLTLYLLPWFALLLQPFVNAIITGTAVSSGNQSKSILAMIPSDMTLIIERIIANILRMFLELMTGFSPTQGWYTLPLVGVFGIIGLVLMLRQSRWRMLSLLMALWFLLIVGAVATLDNAFWHFKRYQMPIQLLLMLAAFVPFAWLLERIQRAWRIGAILLLVTLSVWLTLIPFMHYHSLNVYYVAQQPYQMATWLRENAPEDALIAVHDVGMMRYYGERNTLDMVGLTTPNASSYWRNGPGSVAEFLRLNEPDYIASYGVRHGYGLAYLADTNLYTPQLAEFPIVNWQPEGNVALAADYQAIYQPAWEDFTSASQPLQPYTLQQINQNNLAASLNVADIIQEEAHNYIWDSDTQQNGFASLVYQHPYIHCEQNPCNLLDAGRTIDFQEQWTIEFEQPLQHFTWVMRVHPIESTQVSVGILNSDGTCQILNTATIFQQAGYWLELAIPISLDEPQTSFTLCTQPDNTYQIYYHWLYETKPRRFIPITDNLASYQDNAFALIDTVLTLQDEILVVELTWQSTGDAYGDYRFFLHIYANSDEAPLAQIDGYSRHGIAPPANWHIGTERERFVVNLAELQSGSYDIAIGFYEPNTGERLTPSSSELEISADRLWIGNIEIP